MVELIAAPVSAWAVSDSALRSPCARRQQRDLDLRGRPIAGDGKFLVPVVGDPDRRLGRARQFDRGDGLHAEAALGAETAADMVGDHADLVVRRACSAWRSAPSDGTPTCVEACTVRRSPSKRATQACGSRQACDCVPVRNVALDQQRISRVARGFATQLRTFFGLVRERRRRSADILLPRRRRRRRLRRRWRPSCGSAFRTRPAHRSCARRPVRSPTAGVRW